MKHTIHFSGFKLKIDYLFNFPFLLFNFIAALNPVFTNYAQAQSQLWGITPNGGDQFGTIFSIAPGASSQSNLTLVQGENPGSSPGYTQLVIASNGKFYGMTELGGIYNSGVIFEYDPSSDIYIKKYDFNITDGSTPDGSLMLASNGKLYGMTNRGGTSSRGVLFEFDPSAGIYTKKFDFSTANGSNPYGSLIQATNGKLYGMTNGGGSSNSGVIFEYDINTNTYTKKFDFSTTNGSRPYGSLLQASNGKLYGLTNTGGTSSGGVLFEYDLTSSTYTKRNNFAVSPFTNGYSPYGSLIEASNGKLYGMTSRGGSSSSGGVIFEFDPSSNVYAKKVDLISANGTQPFGTLFKAGNGMLYGITSRGGTSIRGTIFEYSAGTTSYTKKYDFSAADGISNSSFIEGTNGKLYALTSSGGLGSKGTVFEFNYTSVTYTKKKDLSYCPNGSTPYGALLQASDGKLYGMASQGGAFGVGLIFQFDPVTLSYTKKIDFNLSDGASPAGCSLMQASNGKIYGMTLSGGANFSGVIFEYDPLTNSYVKKIDLSPANGYVAYSSLIQASNGKLYSVTYDGGENDLGVLFEYDINTNSYTKKFDFSPASGNSPYSSLVQATNGKLYGMTYFGGVNDMGVLFEYDISSDTYTKKVDFSTVSGSNPIGSLMQASDGMLYGMTTSGALFQYDPVTGNYTVKKNLSAISGSSPTGTLMQSANGKLYGMTQGGGLHGVGIIFQYDIISNTLTKMFDFNGVNGAYPAQDKLIEICSNPSTFYADSDNDGYGNIALTTSACYAPTGFVANSSDCNDTDMNVNPGKTEVCSNGIDDNCNGQTDEGCVSVATLNLTLFIEGYYTGGGMMNQVLFNQGIDPNLVSTNVDTVIVELRSTVDPSIVAYSFKGVLQTNGSLVCSFPSSTVGNSYWIALFHRSAVQTWSANPVQINVSTSYNFSSAASKAYGNNMTDLYGENIWSIHNGDLDQSEGIDIFDFPVLDFDIQSFNFGYYNTDLDGNGSVDIFDFPIIDANIQNFIYSIHP